MPSRDLKSTTCYQEFCVIRLRVNELPLYMSDIVTTFSHKAQNLVWFETSVFQTSPTGGKNTY